MPALRDRTSILSRSSFQESKGAILTRPPHVRLLKEQLFQLPTDEALRLLDRWLVWARRSPIPRFVDLAITVTGQRQAIRATHIHRQSQGRVEALYTSMRLISRSRKAYAFRSPDALIALGMLKLGRLTPPLPGRAA